MTPEFNYIFFCPAVAESVTLLCIWNSESQWCDSDWINGEYDNRNTK